MTVRSENITAKERPDVSVIIVSYNTCELTLHAVRSVLDQKGPAVEVLVVDNASIDGSAERLSREYPEVNLFALNRNLGFGQACNLAADHANGRYLLLLNPDSYPLPDAFSAILDFAQRWPEARIWGGRALHTDGRLNPRSCARRPTLWSVISLASGLAALSPRSGFFNPEAMPGWRRDEESYVDVVVGNFLLIEPAVWQKLGGFDPAYFMYGEDVDLCLRAAGVGARPAITPSAVVVHDGGCSQSEIPRNIQILAGRIRYLSRHLPEFHRWYAIWAVRLGVMLRLLCYNTMSIFLNNNRNLNRLRETWKMREIWWDGYPGASG